MPAPRRPGPRRLIPVPAPLSGCIIGLVISAPVALSGPIIGPIIPAPGPLSAPIMGPIIRRICIPPRIGPIRSIIRS